ncbi:DUF3040 domain-containing protein [Pseudonocardia sp. C8]|uniref:DUF3040 domain-containing protein n=1 Tax=Pseudonocardia sp. C8 TaxID=2762759 RepID=UPI0016431946|nr:DUF3040 domain-containing protein [Pseudonocardia sp. C8]MBC3191127.1 DUF3040 domain-containing protein [Pseudonocardia sp. C8]
MLNDRERKTLHDLEQQLVQDDPGFQRRFETRARELGRPGLVTVLGLVLLVVVVLFLLLAGAVGGALVLAAAGGWAWWMMRGRSRPASGGRPPESGPGDGPG